MKYNFDETKLHQQLTKLPYWKQQLFLLTICQRLLPSYNAFLTQESIEDKNVLPLMIEKVWVTLEGGVTKMDFSDEVRVAEDIAPDTEEYDSILVSSALDAAIAISILMRTFTEVDTALIVEGVSLARDSVDMYVQELENMNSQDPKLELMIQDHKLMQLELQRQNDDFIFIENMDEELLTAIEQAKLKYYGLKNSCLGLI